MTVNELIVLLSQVENKELEVVMDAGALFLDINEAKTWEDNIMRECFIPVIYRVGDSEYDMGKFAKMIIHECYKSANQYIADCGEVNSLPESVFNKIVA
jgi:hypothetical protein